MEYNVAFMNKLIKLYICSDLLDDTIIKAYVFDRPTKKELLYHATNALSFGHIFNISFLSEFSVKPL